MIMHGDTVMSDAEEQKQRSAKKAASYVKDGMVLGLGTGSTVRWLIEELGARKDLTHLKIISSSKDSQQRAQQHGLHIIEPKLVDHIDLVIDGVDQIDEQKQVIKGGGGALVREKILAEAAEHIIWIMDASKRVSTIEAYPLPVEIVPFSLPFVIRRLEAKGYTVKQRQQHGQAFCSDNRNFILDVLLPKNRLLCEAHEELRHIAGVVDTGYFCMDATCVTASAKELLIW